MKHLASPLLACALLVAGCAGSLRAEEPAAAPALPSEQWVVVFTPEAAEALKARPATEHYPAVPRLDGRAVREHAMAQLAHLYRRYRIEFRPFAVAPGTKIALPQTGRYAVVAGAHPRMKGLLGMADGIDPLNRKHKHVVLNFLDTLVDAMRSDPARRGKKPLLITSEQVGVALGTLIAHEIGHTLGCRHNAVETREDLSTLMAQGIDKYGLQYLRHVRIHYQNAVYLDSVLGTRPNAGPVVAKYAHELRSRGTMDAKETPDEYCVQRGPAGVRQQGNRLGH
jgi:hypothetical protein